jgi:hypothetical protein
MGVLSAGQQWACSLENRGRVNCEQPMERGRTATDGAQNIGQQWTRIWEQPWAY